MELELAELLEKDDSNMQHGEHIILRLTYISRYNTRNANVEVTRILEQAQRNNVRNGITGVLVINENYFLQSIEGARPIINELLRELVKDDRHFSLQVIECREVEQRRWNKWSMKYLTLGDQDKKFVLKFSAGTDFNPYLMSTSQIMMFIDTLSELQEQREKYAFEMKKS
ncbi:BLUF domain-containing protein [Psychrobacter frigidicola]|uniref:BLUF domain-containing protein n=1 Tax=Psychrobacter frigidicola TaxID=45611 RepID=UPI00191B3984|nr:BLUF domain-containing protein [Psychrobacter frigidicola]